MKKELERWCQEVVDFCNPKAEQLNLDYQRLECLKALGHLHYPIPDSIVLTPISMEKLWEK